MFIKKVLLLLSVILLSSMIAVANEEPSDTVKEKKIYAVGEKIYQKMCNQDIDLQKYLSLSEMKNAIKNDNTRDIHPKKVNISNAVFITLFISL